MNVRSMSLRSRVEYLAAGVIFGGAAVLTVGGTLAAWIASSAVLG